MIQSTAANLQKMSQKEKNQWLSSEYKAKMLWLDLMKAVHEGMPTNIKN